VHRGGHSLVYQHAGDFHHHEDDPQGS
jgi:hypothetical protein